jgi:hypothetical protein
LNHDEPFLFHTERRLVELTGLRAANLRELRRLLDVVPGSSIFYHTHHRFLSQHWRKPVIYNEFATWTSEALQEEQLGEKLAAIDLLQFTSIRELRLAIMAAVDAHLDAARSTRECPPGAEFHFCQSKSFIMPTGHVAVDVPGFFTEVAKVTNISLFFHLVEARLRLERPTNDFSAWLEWRGETAIARAIDSLDPYACTLDELRQQIIDVGQANGVRVE